MPTPLPSPNGTNFERLYITRGPMARDAAPDDQSDSAKMLTMILAKLSPEEKDMLRQMLDDSDDAPAATATDSAGRTFLDRQFAAGGLSTSDYLRKRAAGQTGAPRFPRETRSFDEMFPQAGRLNR